MYNKGYTFRANLPNSDKKDTYHICIIMNKNDDADLLYIYMTSQSRYIEEHYKKYDPEGFVILEEEEVRNYFVNPVPTYIKCGLGDIFEIEREVMDIKIRNGSFEKVQDVSVSTIEKIEIAIMDSVTYDTSIYSKLRKII